MIPTGVIDVATGDLLRWGYVTADNWKQDGSFDPATEEVRDVLPERRTVRDQPALCYTDGKPDTGRLSKWDGDAWIEVKAALP